MSWTRTPAGMGGTEGSTTVHMGAAIPAVHHHLAGLRVGLVAPRWCGEELHGAIAIDVTHLDLMDEDVGLLVSSMAS